MNPERVGKLRGGRPASVGIAAIVWFAANIGSTWGPAVSHGAIAMAAGNGKVLFFDLLSGPPNREWRVRPDQFVNHPKHGRVCLIGRGSPEKEVPLPLAGDVSWSRYSVEFDFIPKAKGGYAGLSFHVQDNGDACNVSFAFGASGMCEAVEPMHIWGGSQAWKLYPETQGYALFRLDEWNHLRVDVGAAVANVYVNHTPRPTLTVFDLPFERGGIGFWTFYGQMYIRNLKVTDLKGVEIRPLADDPWRIYAEADVLREWRVALVTDAEAQAPESAVSRLDELDLEWRHVQADRRGVVVLSEVFRDNNTKAVAYARTNIVCSSPEKRTLWLTYTDHLSLWCNGEPVFQGPPRGWDDPDRERHYGGRLIPDEYEVTLPLRMGRNDLVVRTEATEPWGWGFWMRAE